MKYPHNQMGFPSRPKRLWDYEEDKRAGTHFHRIWLKGQDPETVEFIEIRYKL